MQPTTEELFLRVSHLSSGEAVWESVSGDFREQLQVGDISAGRGLALCSLVLSLSTHPDRQAFEPLARAALAMAQNAGDEPAMRMCLRALAEHARCDGRNEMALQLTQQIRALGDQEALAEEIELLGLVDQPLLARQLVDRSKEQYRVSGSEWVRSGLAVAELEFNQAFSSVDKTESTARAIAHQSATVLCGAFAVEAHAALARVAQLRGDYAVARSHIATAVTSIDRRTGELSARLSLTRASLALSEGDNTEAFTLFRDVAEQSDRTRRLRVWQPSLLIEAMRCAVAATEEPLAQQIVEFARRLRDGTPASTTFAVLEMQTRGLLGADINLLRDAARLARLSPRRIFRGEVLSDYGRALLNQDRVLEAIAPLDDAWDLFNDVGAQGSALAVQRLLARTGVRRRRWSTGTRRPLEGWGALTDAERRVARLIGAGYSNRSAAAKLGSSPHTVSSQVRSIFGKLAITSRVHLARMVNNEA